MGVIVLGMHRSGTSVAARVINRLGVPLGRGRLVPDTDANPDGHYESWELQDLNNDILAAFGGSWAGPPRLDWGWESDPRAKRLDDEARRVWREVLGSEPWLWKDPRTCLTLPYWRRVTALDGPAVLVYRRPQWVAASLAKRDEFSTPVSLALWERYNRDALVALEGLPVMVASYESLSRAPTDWALRVREFLSKHGLLRAGASGSEATAGVRPLATGCPPVEADLSGPQEELLSTLKAVDGSHEAFKAPELGPPSPWMDTLLTEHGRALARELELRRELGRARSQLGHVVNRTRLKVLVYRTYRRLGRKEPPRPGREDPTFEARP